jgi:zinc transport system substrate-binding protein
MVPIAGACNCTKLARILDDRKDKAMFTKRRCILAITALTVHLAAGLFFGSYSMAGTSKLRVVTSTSLIAQIVERVGGDMVDVVNIIPPAQCPGHFDIKPGDIQKLSDAHLFLLHGWQGEKFSQGLIASAHNRDLTVVRINVKGNWMTPPVQLQATDKITAALSNLDNKNSGAYQESAAEYKNKIKAKEAEMKAKLAQLRPSTVNVLCAKMQAGFVKWSGLNVVATYGRPDSLTPKVVKKLVDQGRGAKVGLIIDNMQSGKDAGAGLAEELGCTRITLSNFPACFENTETWEKAIDRNVELLLDAITRLM